MTQQVRILSVYQFYLEIEKKSYFHTLKTLLIQESWSNVQTSAVAHHQ